FKVNIYIHNKLHLHNNTRVRSLFLPPPNSHPTKIAGPRPSPVREVGAGPKALKNLVEVALHDGGVEGEQQRRDFASCFRGALTRVFVTSVLQRIGDAGDQVELTVRDGDHGLEVAAVETDLAQPVRQVHDRDVVHAEGTGLVGHDQVEAVQATGEGVLDTSTRRQV